MIAFLGASYFRALGRNEGYGVSARGLAIDTATTAGEEFPYFTDFWVVQPQPECADHDDLCAARQSEHGRRL